MKRNHYVNWLKRVLSVAIIISVFVWCSPTVFASSRSLDVATPTQEQIFQYIESHTTQSECPLSYNEKPILTAPYSAGALSAETLQYGLDSLNEVRYIAGLNSNVSLDESYNELCQAASLLNAVNGELTHYPTQPDGMGSALFDLGYEGAGHSNISENFDLDSTLKHTMIHGWMADEATYNIATLGHRRWCLNPDMGKTGFGVAIGMDESYGKEAVFSSMYSMDDSYDSSVSTVVWPAQNMPTDYFDGDYPWSISSDTAFSNDVKVILTHLDGDLDADNDKKWEFSSASADGYFNYNQQGYGQRNCLIFRPNDITMYYDGDQYMVQVMEGGVVTLEYTVNFFDLNPIPEDVSLSLSKSYGSMVLREDGLYWSSITITISDPSISTDRIKISTSDANIADAILGDNNNGKTTVYIQTNANGVAQLLFELSKNIKVVYKVTVGNGGDHVHNNIEISVEEATCTQTGLRELECEGCGVPSTEVIPLANHRYDEGVTTTQPTCSSEGEKLLTCTVCKGTTTEVIAKVDHEYEANYTIDKEPSCKEEGSQSYHCIWYEECGSVSEVTAIDKTDDHNYDEGVVTKEPTCTIEGERTFTCEVCEGIRTEAIEMVDHQYEANYTIDKEPNCKEEGSQSYHCKWYSVCRAVSGVMAIDKTDDHSYDEGVVTTEPTCTTEGEKTFTCEVCEGTKTEKVSMIDHDYDEGVVSKEPTCTAEGERTFTCEVCKGTKTEAIETIDHRYETSYTIDKEPNCKEEGSKSFHCVWYTECGLVSEVTAIDKTDDHDYGEGVVTTEPTCTTEGEKTYTCSVCEGTRTESVGVVSHSYEDDFIVDEEATCIDEGSKSRHCKWYSTCGEITDVTVVEVNDNHRYNAGEVTKAPTCTVEGERTFTCDECKDTKVVSVEKVAHEYATEFTIDQEPTCTVNGSKSRHCKDCDDKTDVTVVLAAGHVAGEWIIDKEASYTETGSRHKECSVCNTVMESESLGKLVAEKGATAVVGNGNYTISSNSSNKKEVTYAGPQNKLVQSVVIPGTVRIGDKVYKVTTVSANALANCKHLKTVKLGKYVTKVGKNAFSGCTKLSKVTLPSKLTVIESGAFARCTSLKSITIPSSVKKIGSKAFYKCKKLRKITIKTSKLKSSTVGKKAFSGIHKKAKVKVPKKKLKAYKKFLKKKGLPKKATIKK